MKRSKLDLELASTTDRLKVMVDASHHNMAKKLYHTFIDEENYRRFPGFLLSLDQLLQDFGGKAPTDESGNSRSESDEEDPEPASEESFEEAVGKVYAELASTAVKGVGLPRLLTGKK